MNVSAASPKAAKRVLIVEDEAIIALTLTQQLEDLGYVVAGVARRGDEAVQKALDLRPDVTLMDIVLQGPIDGISAAEAIRERVHVPVIFLTAYADPATIERAVHTTPYGYLNKPYQLRELRAAIEIAMVRASLEHELRESREWFESTLRAVGDGVIATDGEARVRFMNAAAETLVGTCLSAARGRDIGELFALRDPHSKIALRQPIHDALSADAAVRVPFGTELLRVGAPALPIDDSASPVRDARGRRLGAVWVFRDVVERKRLEDELQRLAHFDPLTGLVNRARLRLDTDHLLARARRDHHLVAVLFLDLDQFKHVNDTLGHAAGDELLQRIGERLRARAREIDVVARLGGDEFVIAAEVASADGAYTVADKLLHAVVEPLELLGQRIRMSASVGIALFPHDGADVDTLLRNADSALYLAKGTARGTVQFYRAELTRRSEHRLRLHYELSQALNDEQLTLHYQPIVTIGDASLLACEALLRWPRQSGLEHAGEIVSIVEESGMILPLGRWVLESACTTASTWPTMAAEAPAVSVNVSARQFVEGRIVEAVENALAASGLPASRLWVEITESVLLLDSEANLATLAALSALGVTLVVDDFGTGYSSLTYLHRFAPRLLKIDRSFVARLDVESRAQEIVAATIDMAHRLGIQVIVEGVETREQLEHATRLGADAAQGYYLQVPVAASHLDELMTERR